MRLWILNHFHNNNKIPKIDKETFCTSFRVIKMKSQGNKSELFKEFDNLYSSQKEDAKQLTQVLTQYSSIEMFTAFEIT